MESGAFQPCYKVTPVPHPKEIVRTLTVQNPAIVLLDLGDWIEAPASPRNSTVNLPRPVIIGFRPMGSNRQLQFEEAGILDLLAVALLSRGISKLAGVLKPSTGAIRCPTRHPGVRSRPRLEAVAPPLRSTWLPRWPRKQESAAGRMRPASRALSPSCWTWKTQGAAARLSLSQGEIMSLWNGVKSRRSSRGWICFCQTRPPRTSAIVGRLLPVAAICPEAVRLHRRRYSVSHQPGHRRVRLQCAVSLYRVPARVTFRKAGRVAPDRA